jgi:Holliday junction resolvase-like predicted endonuclease
MNMMTNQLEQQEIQEVIREYQQEGFEVIALEDVEHLPEFLRDYQPDLVFKKADEMVVVEVKTRSTLKDHYLPHLAQEIERYSNWRLDLRVFHQEEPYRPIAVDAIHNRLNQTQQLTGLGQFEAAFLVLWSAIEATLKVVCGRENVSIPSKTISALVLIKTLVSLGLLDDDGSKVLHLGFELRNELVHGLELSESNSELVHRETFIYQLSDIIEQLLSS